MIDEIVNTFSRPDPPAQQRRMGFFTDTTLCIGCKACEVAGAMANDLTSIVTDVNVSIHEAKAFVCNIRPGRLYSREMAPSEAVAARPEPRPMPGTGDQAQPEGRTA